MRRSLRAIGVAAGLGAAVLLVGPGPAIAAAGGGTWDQYGLTNVSATGNYVDSGGQVSGRWKNTPTSSGRSWTLAWGDNDGEHFLRAGDWVVLDGWESNGGYYVQHAATETIGDVDCAGMRPMPIQGGRQNYTAWNLNPAGYCLDASGTITGPGISPLQPVHFRHWQIWAVGTCPNRFHPPVACVTQHEKWWDDNNPKRQQTLTRDRVVAFGLGKGPAWTIRQEVPFAWTADQRDGNPG